MDDSVLVDHPNANLFCLFYRRASLAQLHPEAGNPSRLTRRLYSPGALKGPRLANRRLFKTSAGPIEIPAVSLPFNPHLLTDGRGSLEHDRGVWLREPVQEMTIFAEYHDFSISISRIARRLTTARRRQSPTPMTALSRRRAGGSGGASHS